MNFDATFEEFKFPATYELCSIVEGVLEDGIGYARVFDEMFGEGRVVHFMDGFGHRHSSLLRFIEELCFRYYREITEKVSYQDYLNVQKRTITQFDQPKLSIDRILEVYNSTKTGYAEWLSKKNEDDDKDPVCYFDDVALEVEEALSKASYEIFHILFQNRSFLQKYNDLLAGQLELFWENPDFWNEEDKKLFTAKGKIKRTSIPIWAQRAIFFRDRGKCVFCLKDLSGLLSCFSVKNFDHIIPLNNYGSNDVSNLQLACGDCNNKKSGNTLPPQARYERWF